MGRLAKVGLDYYPRKVGIFQNQKIERLIANCGWVGYAVWDFLLDRIYQNGYYYNWPDDEAEMIALKMSAGVTGGLVREVLRVCFAVSLFSEEVYSVHKVLTSPGIQRRYCKAAAERRNKEVIAEFWLLKNDESAGFIKCALKNAISPGNADKSPINEDLSGEKCPRVEESKVKDKENNSCSGINPARNPIYPPINADLSPEKPISPIGYLVNTDFGRAMAYYQDKIAAFGSTAMIPELQAFVGAMGADVCIRAIDRAIDSSKRNWSYIKGILRGWQRDGVKNLADVDRLQEEWERSKGGSYGAGKSRRKSEPAESDFTPSTGFRNQRGQDG